MNVSLQFRDVLAAWEVFLEGIQVTLILSLAAFAGGLVIGIAGAAARTYGPAWLRWIVAAYVEVFRNTPLLVQLFVVFFALPAIGVRFDNLTAAIIALTINLGSYTTEIIRAGFESIPEGQIEAGRSLGLSGPQVFRHVIFGQAFLLMVPALSSQFIFFMLGTAAVSLVQSRTFRDFEVYIVIAAIYLVLAQVLRLGIAGAYALAIRGRA
jgi:polar amino acid transport system permease protein